MNRQRLLIVANANAARASESLAPVLAILGEAGFDIDVRRPDGPDELRQLVRQCQTAASAIVMAGGDGTINAVLPELIDSRCPLGILPLGTANDLALTLAIPPDLEAAARIIAARHRRRIDVGEANGHPFVNVASIGLGVQVAEHLRSESKRQWGVLSYALTALQVLKEADRFDAVIHCDGKAHEVSAYQIAVGNGVHYGGGMTVAEDAAIDDGILDVHTIDTRSIADLVALLPALRAGRLGANSGVTVFRCRNLRIETRPAAPVSTDGEVATETPVTFTIRRRALEVLAPPQ